MTNPMAMRTVRCTASMSALAASLLLAATSFAQTAQTPPPAEAPTAPPQEEDAGSDIVVTGIRASLQGALDAKRNATQVLDAISAEDIGKFPDKNIGEALQRVTGVQISRFDGEGAGVTIRGADPSLNRVEVNGTSVLSTTVAGGRDVDFRDLPAEFVNRLEVVKSVTADMTEGGLGGTVRIITRRPFDNGGETYLAGSAQTIFNQLAESFDPKAALIGSTTFGDGKFGILLSGTYEDRTVESHQARTTGWRQIDGNPAVAGLQPLDLDGNGAGDFFPDIPRYVINRLNTERIAFNGILEWRPDDRTNVYVEGNYTQSDQEVSSQFLQLSTAGSGVSLDLANTTIGEDDTVDRVTFVNNPAAPAGQQLQVAYRNILGNIERKTYNLAVGGDWKTDTLVLSTKMSYAKAEAYNNEINATADAVGLSRVTIDYSNDQAGPNIQLPVDPRTTQGVNRLTVLRRPRYNDQRELAAKVDLEWKPLGSFITSMKTGAQVRELTADSLYFNTSTVLDGIAPANAAVRSNIQNILAANATLGDVPFFKTGDLGFGGPGTWLNLLTPVADAVGVPDPFNSQVFTDTWDVTELNIGGYAQAAFAFDLGFDLTGVIGARVVNTKTTSNGFRSAGTPAVITPVSFDGETTEFLPSLNLRAEMIPDRLFLRATATEVIARPLPQQLAPRFTLDVVGLSGSRGNPELEPFRARQYDAGVEYYINNTSFASVTYFRKEIGSFIQNTLVPEVIDGVTYNINLPTNGTQKVTINGVEAGLQLALDFLPGPFLNKLGVIANYTYSKDSGYEGRDFFTGGALPFPGLSEHSYNISAYYEDEVFSLRGAYNWRSDYLIVPVGRGNNPEFGEAYGQFDASANLNLNDDVSVFLEGVNLTDATRAENANSIFRRTILETFGRRLYAGVRFRF
ncbi:TonB-dependent receptor [Sphingomonas sp. AX6]|uniref:TonB-dependent receptor n=1 Tax=Sphingomonas sp. AX6 TaxID=2653171 RepID=UPI0012F01922|nr:TonB-dependent receptor [Sphingomonas sp. AX6]VXC79261.1 TonB-denpendent receptor [Sphingomonas sp. AX6]